MKFYPPGARIAGRYEVASRPLLGGMGIVYLCMDREEDRPVALKTFKSEYLPNREARDRFLREGLAERPPGGSRGETGWYGIRAARQR